jgi:hypothetical protein
MSEVVPLELFDEVYAMFGYAKSNAEVRAHLLLVAETQGITVVCNIPRAPIRIPQHATDASAVTMQDRD